MFRRDPVPRLHKDPASAVKAEDKNHDLKARWRLVRKERKAKSWRR
jgi:hypothetical protein